MASHIARLGFGRQVAQSRLLFCFTSNISVVSACHYSSKLLAGSKSMTVVLSTPTYVLSVTTYVLSVCAIDDCGNSRMVMRATNSALMMDFIDVTDKLLTF